MRWSAWNGFNVAMHVHAKVGKHGFSRYMINGNAWCGVEREKVVRGMMIGMKMRGTCGHEVGMEKGQMGLERSGGMHGHGNGYMCGYDSSGWGSVDERQPWEHNSCMHK